MLDKIIIKGAKEHNLQNIDLELPKNKLIVFTGLSGSGKSSLAFDTIFAEGQRRYIESLSSYARQFLGQMEKPNVEYIEGLSPAIAIDQKSASHNPRSTVGTITEIYDYLRLLFAKIGKPHCPNCGKLIQALSIDQMVEKILDEKENSTIRIYAPVVRSRKGEYHQLLYDYYKEGFAKARINGKIYDLSKQITLERYKSHVIDILIDEMLLNSDNISRLNEAIELSIKLTDGLAKPEILNGEKIIKEMFFNQKLSCPDCEISFPEIEPRLFSFNSPFGACPTCNGLGFERKVDPNLIIPDYNKTIGEGAVLPFSYKNNNYFGSLINSVTEDLGLVINTRLKDWKQHQINYLLYGPETGSDRIKIRVFSHGQRSFYMNFNGIIAQLERRWKDTESDYIRGEIEKYMSLSHCKTCNGDRLKKEALLVKVNNKNISEITRFSINDANEFFINISLTKRELLICDRILKEIIDRLNFLISVGLDYLTLNRTGFTLSGGEAQRIRLASQIGSALTGVLYVLDEPSIGLHSRDQEKLLGILKKLRDLGNTVLVVEHDEQTIRNADWITDIGPLAGKNGGKIVFNGVFNDLLKNKESITANYLSGIDQIEIPQSRKKSKNKFITIRGANEHNLKNISVHFPLGMLTCVTGVSGSGKSTLVNDILYKSLARIINKSLEKPGKYAAIEGYEDIKKLVDIDQSPIGRTPRSNPATYTGIFTPIRELFSQTKDAKIKGYSPGRFSFNVYGGRCEVCKGDGLIKIEMQFLPDVYVPCETCSAKRYNNETLKIKYKEKNIFDVLDMTVDEAKEFFAPIDKISDKLNVLSEVGLGYIKLGQSATTLSGGEAQRIKLATELSKSNQGKSVYILDEPTTGLHFADIKKLLEVLRKLVDAGNTIIIIEHNLDVIKTADHIIDLGPEGGDNGGQIIALGTPEEVSKKPDSYTGQFLRKIL